MESHLQNPGYSGLMNHNPEFPRIVIVFKFPGWLRETGTTDVKKVEKKVVLCKYCIFWHPIVLGCPVIRQLPRSRWSPNRAICHPCGEIKEFIHSFISWFLWHIMCQKTSNKSWNHSSGGRVHFHREQQMRELCRRNGELKTLLTLKVSYELC